MLEVRGLARTFSGAAILTSVDLEIAAGEWVAVVGESGSGKSTLLNIVAGLDRPERGSVRLGDFSLEGAGDDALSLWRRRNVGFVFQAFHLLPYLDVAANVALPLALLGATAAQRHARALAALESVGLAGFADRRPGTLSGGEMQRVAIARALVHEPALVLADEPTGNLDATNAAGVLACLGESAHRARAAVLMVTHSRMAAGHADRVLRLDRGTLVPDTAAGSHA